MDIWLMNNSYTQYPFDQWKNQAQYDTMNDAPIIQNILVASFLLLASLFEWLSGRNKDGRKSKQDWHMAAICLSAMYFIQRPAVYFGIYFLLSYIVPQYQGALRWLDQDYFAIALIGFVLIEDLLHGAGHWICHTKPFQNKNLRRIQAVYKVAHRPHHFSGSNDGKGQVNATQSFVEGWAYWFLMPNYWFHYIALYLGLYDAFMVGLAFKGLWSVHNHVNWNYDLYFHNHRQAWVRKTMWGLSHILIFPTQHHHHHARGPNSARNLHNLFAFYDWLLWGTLAIEQAKPTIYGWRQAPEEESALRRFFSNNTQRYMFAPVKKP